MLALASSSCSCLRRRAKSGYCICGGEESHGLPFHATVTLGGRFTSPAGRQGGREGARNGGVYFGAPRAKRVKFLSRSNRSRASLPPRATSNASLAAAKLVFILPIKSAVFTQGE